MKNSLTQASSSCSVPVLYIVFNRPDCVKQSFERIRTARPQHLYIACDGPRDSRRDDLVKVTQVREQLETIDWPCTVHRLYHEKNLGCGKAVSGALDWFFSHVEYGIILEDDCIADPSFFTFCSELLLHYENDTRIMCITGRNVLGRFTSADEASYFFFSGLSIWGWATWRRAWKQFDLSMKDWPVLKKSGILYSHFPKKIQQEAYATLESTYLGKIDTWDYQWSYAMEKQSGLTIVPNINLIRNVGFGETATHTHIENPDMSSLKEQSIPFPLQHPCYVRADSVYSDRFLRMGAKSMFNRVSLLAYNAVKHPGMILKKMFKKK